MQSTLHVRRPLIILIWLMKKIKIISIMISLKKFHPNLNTSFSWNTKVFLNSFFMAKVTHYPFFESQCFAFKMLRNFILFPLFFFIIIFQLFDAKIIKWFEKIWKKGKGVEKNHEQLILLIFLFKGSFFRTTSCAGVARFEGDFGAYVDISWNFK